MRSRSSFACSATTAWPIRSTRPTLQRRSFDATRLTRLASSPEPFLTLSGAASRPATRMVLQATRRAPRAAEQRRLSGPGRVDSSPSRAGAAPALCALRGESRRARFPTDPSDHRQDVALWGFGVPPGAPHGPGHVDRSPDHVIIPSGAHDGSGDVDIAPVGVLPGALQVQEMRIVQARLEDLGMLCKALVTTAATYALAVQNMHGRSCMRTLRCALGASSSSRP